METLISEAVTAGFTSLEIEQERQRLAPQVLAAVSDSTDFDLDTYQLKSQLARENGDGD